MLSIGPTTSAVTEEARNALPLSAMTHGAAQPATLPLIVGEFPDHAVYLCEVAVDHAQSIQNTSVRPNSITSASCG